MFNRINKDIYARFGMIFLLGCIIPALIVGVMMFHNTRNRLQQDTERELATIVSLKKEWFETWLKEREKSLESLSNSLFFVIKDDYRLRQTLYRALQNNPDFFEFYLISWPEGVVEVSTDSRSEGRILTNRDYYRNAIAYPGVQPIYYSVYLRSPALTFVETVRNEEGRVLYLIAGRARMEKLSEILSLVMLGRGENSYLINRFGAFMIMSDRIENESIITSPALNEAVDNGCYGGRYVNSRGEEVIGYCSYIDFLNAILVSEIEYGEVMKPLVRSMSNIGLIIIIAVIVGFLIFYLLLRNSLKPVVALTGAVESAASGDLSIRVKVAGEDQIAKLAYNFNEMIAQLEQSILELRAVEEKERRLVQKANDAFLITDELGNIIRTNPRAQELWGYSEREMLNMSVFDFFTEQSSKDFGRYFRILSQQKAGRILELNALRSNGQVFAAEINAIALGDGTYLSIIRDMSEKRKLEQELIHAQKLESVGTLAAGIAHDFDNILVGVLGAASYLKSLDTLGETETEMLNVIEESAERAAGLVKQLMTFARQETPNRERVQIQELVEEVVRLLSKGLGEDIELVVRRSDELPEVYVDPIQIKQTLFNICLNGRDAMPEGGELAIDVNPVNLDELFVQTHPTLKPGRFIQISISDNGIGIPEDQLARIFEPFYTTKPAGTGTGLGLAVSYGIIEAHGGTITLDSRLGIGTSFHIYLPAIDPDTPVVKTAKSCVLVVSQDNATQKLLRLALVSKHFDSIVCGSIREARKAVNSNDKIELVFIGVETLGDDPIANLKEIKDMTDKAGIYILGELPSKLPMTQIDGSVRDRYDVTSIIAIVRRYMGLGKNPR